jgi:dienelactone hydrolase
MRFGKRKVTLVLAALLAAGVTADANAQFVRQEVIPFESQNVSMAEVLNGVGGPKVMLAGLLRMAKAGPNQPVVVILHGAGGIGPRHSPQDEWAWVFNEAGFSTFTVDSFSGRDINTPAEVGKVSPLGRIADAFAALEVLSKHPLVDPKKVVVMGLSHGSLAAIYSAMARFQKQYGGHKFAANISVYGGCGTKFREDEEITSPILFLHVNSGVKVVKNQRF